MSGEKLPSQRQLRVGELVRHALSAFLSRDEILDPDLDGAFITVPEVRMTPDLKLAKVYVMPLGGQKVDVVVDALNRNQKFIRGQVAPKLDLKYAPQFRFYADETFDEAGRIDQLLRSDHVAQDLDHEDQDDDIQDH
ncbi:30S ribosome-binding factor RbfA [Maritalea porphyrae]|uniref:Ribosome-binding factor A n=1 Tax=Maritalea porphyrae TaxID=880732 RepID=A0ABQ5UNV8_9HYPH|nr:30S ribosome-binding factor RbfA [Maritalea porphyrae]GLQ16939.1 ribosome-binding factor A [Maritalea porphyrae]